LFDINGHAFSAHSNARGRSKNGFSTDRRCK
jgi:hypothetical protein